MIISRKKYLDSVSRAYHQATRDMLRHAQWVVKVSGDKIYEDEFWDDWLADMERSWALSMLNGDIYE